MKEVLLNPSQFEAIQTALKQLNNPLIEWLSLVGLFVTAAFTYLAAEAARDSARAAVRPTAFFFLRSMKTEAERTGVDFEALSRDQQLASTLRVQSLSKVPIQFHISVLLEAGGEQVRQDQYWDEEALTIYPEKQVRYPNLVQLMNLSPEALARTTEVVGTFKYHFAPIHAPKQRTETITETWRYNLKENQWIGNAGIRDRNIDL